MNEKAIIVGMVILAVSGVLTGCTRGPEIVIREPPVPDESTIDYSMLPEPPVNLLELVKYLPHLLDLINPKVKKVTEDVYVAMGYGLGQVVMVITDAGLVIIDTCDNEESAEKIRADFRKITDQPVKVIIYTHYHPDHTQGASVFYEPGVEVISTEDLLYWLKYQNELLGEHHLRARANQSGQAEPDYAFPIPIENPYHGAGYIPDVVMPTITFKDEYTFTLGDKLFKLIHTSGETKDHLAVWLPDERILFPGDLYYASFPNLSTPMLESRPVQDWIDSITLFTSLEPKIKVPHHTNPVLGSDIVHHRLTSFRDAIKYIHDETVRYIDMGKTVHEAVAEIKLPSHLAMLPHLDELYGKIEWSIRGIYHGYKGWYDGKGTELYPLPPAYKAREIVALAGGADAVLARAIEVQNHHEHQLCLELCDIVIAANPNDGQAHRIKASSLHYLAYSRPNLNSIGFYRSAYSIHMKAAAAAESCGASPFMAGSGCGPAGLPVHRKSGLSKIAG